MKNKDEKIKHIVDLVFNYLEIGIMFFIVFLFMTYGINILQTQKTDHFFEGYIIIVSAYLSYYILTSSHKKRENFNKYIIHIIATLLCAYIIVVGILDLQTEHFPEENYTYFGRNLIIMGVIGILFAQWRVKKIKRKEDN